MSATDPPTPTLPPDAPEPAGIARAIVEVSLSLVAATAPLPVTVTEAPPVTCARLCVSIRFSATAPATPTLEPPAPAEAFASNTSRCCPLLPTIEACASFVGSTGVGLTTVTTGDTTPRSSCVAFSNSDEAV